MEQISCLCFQRPLEICEIQERLSVRDSDKLTTFAVVLVLSGGGKLPIET